MVTIKTCLATFCKRLAPGKAPEAGFRRIASLGPAGGQTFANSMSWVLQTDLD